MKSAIFFVLFVGVVWSAPTEEDHLKQLVLANRLFASNVYKELLKTNEGNLIFSPFSAETILALTAEGAKGETRDELLKGLSLPSSKEDIQKAFKEFLPKLTENSDKLKLLSANKIYARNDVKLETEFQKVAVDIYDSAIQNIDFAQNVEAAKTINDWVEDHTNNKIKNLISKDDVSADTALVLVNALYLAANWTHKFSEYGTVPQKFYKTEKDVVMVPTMSQTEYFNYYENKDLGAKFLELPFETPGLSMVIVLPNEKEGLTAIEQNTEKLGKLFETQPLTRERVDVKLPTFKIDSEIKFVPILKNLGIKKLFEDADLTDISSTHKNLYVSDVIQKAFINVTETGVEAAAATAVIVWDSISMPLVPPPRPKVFHADHPFTYYIQYKGVVLFAGHINLKE